MKKILVPTDFSDNAKNALNYALQVAEKTKAEVILFHAFHAPVVDAQMPGNMIASLVKEEEKISKQKLKGLIKEIQSQKQFAKIKCRFVVSLGFSVEEINSAAADQNVDLIVMGTKGASGLKELMIGSNTAAVIEKCRVPVLAIPDKAKFAMIEKIVYATDFKSDDLSVIGKLAEFAKLFNAQIAVLHISPASEKDADAKLDKLFTEVKYKLDYERMSFHILNKDKIAEGIDGFVKYSEADLLAMATYQRGLFDSLFHKSITKKMVLHTHIPLFAFHKSLKK